ncbi:MAG: helix-turn-helix transcriptional regulator [Rubrivivax sp.]
MRSSVDPSELLATQRGLRDRLLSGKVTGDGRRQRELAAEMLLYLDEPQACWEVGARWLMSVTAADRIDAGFSSPRDIYYRPSFELVRADLMLPRVLGTAMNARDPGIAMVWRSTRVVVVDDVRSDRRLGPGVRAALLAAGTRRKLAVALRDAEVDVGLLCVDAGAGDTWRAEECARLDGVARDVMAPILAAVRRLANDDEPLARGTVATESGEECHGLTPTERRVARLVLAGCSYKEIARQFDRSVSTIDHHLRSMRHKLGVNSTAKLMHHLMIQVPVPAAPGAPASPNGGRH